jgi:hypothetical protein
MVNGGNRDAYMDATVLLVSVGADAMGASGVTMVGGVVVRAVVGMTMTGPAVTATSPPRDSRGDIVGGTSCNTRRVCIRNVEGLGVWGWGWIILGWLRVHATARRGSGRDVVCCHP